MLCTQRSFAEECQSIVTKLSSTLPRVEFMPAPQEEINEVLFHCRCIASFNKLHISSLKYFLCNCLLSGLQNQPLWNERSFSLYIYIIYIYILWQTFTLVIREFTHLFIIPVIDDSHFYLNLTSCAVLNLVKMVQRPNYRNYKGMQE